MVAAALYWERAARLLGRVLDALVRLAPPRSAPPSALDLRAAIDRLRGDTADIVHRRWAGLSGGMTAFLVFQCLIIACLVATGAYPGPAETVAVFALSRVLTTALVTPSGAGIMEGGVATLLVAFGEPAAEAAAAALLFGFWTYTVEIPVGRPGPRRVVPAAPQTRTAPTVC